MLKWSCDPAFENNILSGVREKVSKERTNTPDERRKTLDAWLQREDVGLEGKAGSGGAAVLAGRHSLWPS